jgi:hypothetical protein
MEPQGLTANAPPPTTLLLGMKSERSCSANRSNLHLRKIALESLTQKMASKPVLLVGSKRPCTMFL